MLGTGGAEVRIPVVEGLEGPVRRILEQETVPGNSGSPGIVRLQDLGDS